MFKTWKDSAAYVAITLLAILATAAIAWFLITGGPHHKQDIYKQADY